MLDYKKLSEVSLKNKTIYQQATPFPHVVIDNLFSNQLLSQIVDEYPSPTELDWIRYDSLHEKKLESQLSSDLGPKAQGLMSELMSPAFLDFLQNLTGIENLIPDPELDGGGFHQIQRGGYLHIHADFNIHQKLELHRRLNLIIYLNKDWDKSFGGNLELWNKNMDKCEQSILATFNRLVVFSTSRTSYHGHPSPLTCPSDRTRKSLAVYYYTKDRPSHEIYQRSSTIWKSRPNEKWRRQWPEIADNIKSYVFKIYKTRLKFNRK